MKLSESQIKKLFTFVRSKYVRYVDVQYELVDHLASDIQSKMDENPTLSFDAALMKAYAKFPITGFSKFVSEKEIALRKVWRNKYMVFILGFFSMPKIIFGVALVYIWFYLFEILKSLTDHVFFMPITLVTMLIMCFFCWKKANLKKYDDYLVVVSYKQAVGLIFAPFYLIPYQTIESFNQVGLGFYLQFAAAIFFSFWTLVMYASFFIMPDLLKEEVTILKKHLVLQ